MMSFTDTVSPPFCRRVLELGGGSTGLCGLSLASSPNHSCREVVITDGHPACVFNQVLCSHPSLIIILLSRIFAFECVNNKNRFFLLLMSHVIVFFGSGMIQTMNFIPFSSHHLPRLMLLSSSIALLHLIACSLKIFTKIFFGFSTLLSRSKGLFTCFNRNEGTPWIDFSP